MKKRLIKIFTSLLLLVSLTSCSTREKLLLLNWGEYINDDVVLAFEEEYNCDVVISLAESNELFYSKVKSGTTAYDLVVPSDYMVEKMVTKDLLQKIDFTLLDNYTTREETFLPGCNGIISSMEETLPGVSDYFVPYFWGTWGLMYNKNKAGLEEAVLKADSDGNVWKVMFEDSAVPAGTRVGMYDTPRYAYAATMFYSDLSPNLQSDEALNVSRNVLSKKKFHEWGTDTMKKNITASNLDIGFMWTGDFLDMLYTQLEETTDRSDITFDICIPDNTIAFMDNLVIPKNARNVELAHKFIDFFLDSENAYENASVVGYCTPSTAAYDMIVDYEEGTDLEDDIWLTNWAWAVSTYYPKFVDNEKGYKGTPLANLDQNYLNKINTLCNNAKV